MDRGRGRLSVDHGRPHRPGDDRRGPRRGRRRARAEDAWPVVTEPFTQWVIEDRFPRGPARTSGAGAQLVADVAPFELMKLRLLNGAHSTIAYLGYLAGYETVADAMADPISPPFAAADGREAAADPRCPGTDLTPTAASLLAALRQSGAAAPHLADRHGRLAETAAAAARHRAATGWRRAADRPASRSGSPPGCATSRGSMSGRADRRARPVRGKVAAIAQTAGPVADRLTPALLGVNSVFGAISTPIRACGRRLRMRWQSSTKSALGERCGNSLITGMSVSAALLPSLRSRPLRPFQRGVRPGPAPWRDNACRTIRDRPVRAP